MDTDRIELDEEEEKLWLLWRDTFKSIYDSIVKETIAKTGISEGDYTVLYLLSFAKGGTLRQHELAESMRWTRSRLSHYLTRMEKRGLIKRDALDKGVQVTATDSGKSALDATKPVVAEATRKYFIDLLTEQDIKSIVRLAAEVKKIAEAK